MRHLLHFLLPALLAYGPQPPAHAQQNASGGIHAVAVKGLDSTTRDAIARDLHAVEGPRLVFACVPAGILVFQGGTDAASLRSAVDPLLRMRTREQDITDLGIGLAEAEARCAQTRDR